jgi:threo-3-hydroxy-L-aspartate ammonia-lyase
MLTIEVIEEAAERIQDHVVRTPVLTRTVGNATLLIKPEGLQATGAFKLRGAINKMSRLPADCPGVVAHSSGNHAQAVARAAKLLGIRAVIVMPDDAPPLKRQRTEADGAEVIVVGPDSDERRLRAAAIAIEQDLVPVEPYDDLAIAAGQGTVALELLQDAGPIDRLYAPVSGGGLMAGCAVATRALCPSAEIIGVEPATKTALHRSLISGEREAVAPPQTIADGLRVRRVGEKTWPILKSHVDRVVLVDEAALEAAMAWALNELRIVLEPSGAAALAAALSEGRGRAGVVCTGGNVDPALLARIAARVASGS